MERPRGQDEPAGASPAAGLGGAVADTGKLLASGYQGAVYLVETETGRVIVKRAMGGALARAVRRAMLRREHDIYRLLEGVQGIPRCYGLREGGELVLQFVDGPSLRAAPLDVAEREQFFAALLRLIESMHRARVAHGDLKRKDNLLVGPGGQPFLIDFGTAVSAPPGAGPLRRLLFRQLRRMDLNAWFKLKYQGGRGEVAPADLARFRPTLAERLARVVRRAWRTVTLRRRRRARRSRRR